MFQESNVVKSFPCSFSGKASLKQHPLDFETKQAWVIWMASLSPIQALTSAQSIEHVSISIDSDAQVDGPATVIHPIYTPLAMVKQSSRLAIEAMELKNQPPQGLDPWPGVCGKGTVASIACLVIVNDGKQQTHRKDQPTGAN